MTGKIAAEYIRNVHNNIMLYIYMHTITNMHLFLCFLSFLTNTKYKIVPSSEGFN